MLSKGVNVNLLYLNFDVYVVKKYYSSLLEITLLAILSFPIGGYVRHTTTYRFAETPA